MMAADQVRFIVKHLNEPPFNKKCNILGFDDLKPELLLQVLNDVFAEIEPKMKAEIKIEDPEKLVMSTLDFLRILKYKLPPNITLPEFRKGLVIGSKPVIHHILAWLLGGMPDLKKRAYLAQYLVKIDVPDDIKDDSEVEGLYSTYLKIIQNFTDTHKQNELMRASGYSTQDIRKDLEHMEIEKEQLSRKIDRFKMKVVGRSNVDVILSLAQKIREEKEREESLSYHRREQRNFMTHGNAKIAKYVKQVKELKSYNSDSSPQSIVKKLEEEIKVNSYMALDKLPKEIDSVSKCVKDLERVIKKPALGQFEIDQITGKIKTVNSQISALVEKRMINNDPIDDKLSLFRQQASIIKRKKEISAEELNASRNALTKLQAQIAEKQTQNRENEGEYLRGDEFKRYVNKLRGKSNIYKKKRQEVAEMRAECGVLSRTADILQQRDVQITNTLCHLEEQKGIGGYHIAQEELEKVSSKKAEIDEEKGQTLEEMSVMVRRLNARLAEKKARLAPIIKELRPLRQHCQDMTFEYDQKKSAYDACALSLESNVSKLDQQVTNIKTDIASNETKLHMLDENMNLMKSAEKIVAEELKIYVSSDPDQRKKSLRDLLTLNIQKQEAHIRVLRDQQRMIKETQTENEKQMKLWADVQVLFAGKLVSLKKKKSKAKEDAKQKAKEEAKLKAAGKNKGEKGKLEGENKKGQKVPK